MIPKDVESARYPASSGFPEDDGANFTPPTMGELMKKQDAEGTLLRESRAVAQVIKEARQFHEKQAVRHGITTRRGLAHMRAARMFTKEAGTKMQEMFENGGEVGELPPAIVAKANKAAIQFHKKQAEKAGLDSDLGHAHTAAMEHHMDILNKAKAQHGAQHPDLKGKKEAFSGASGKKSPVPVPKKSDQPSEDIRQDKPAVPLKRLQQTPGAHAGIIKASRGRAISRFGKKREAGYHAPKSVNDQLDSDKIFVGYKPKKMLDNSGLTSKESRRRRHL